MSEKYDGLDLKAIIEKLVQYGPAVILLLRQLLEVLDGPQPPIFAAPAPGCGHKELCEQTLKAALHTARVAADHYAECCRHE